MFTRIETWLKSNKKKMLRSNPMRSVSNANLLKIDKEKFASSFSPQKSFDTNSIDNRSRRKNTTYDYSKVFQGDGALSKLLKFWNESTKSI